MSKLLQELADVSDVFNITEVKFGLLNPEALKIASVCHVTVPETYEGSEPKENGLFDPRMGVIERGRICPTDEYDHTITPGYFGHIELPLPVFWIQHMETIVKLLRCVCIRCANILIDKSNPAIMKELKKKNGANAFKWISDHCSKQTSKKCVYNGGCNAVQPNTYRKLIGEKFKSDNIVQIEAEYSADVFKDATEKKMKFVLSAENILNIFKRITHEDADLLGFDNHDARPEWMICTVVPVAPPAVRPSVRQDNNQRAEDDLTSKFAAIIKASNALKKELEKSLKKETDAEKESSARNINGIRANLQYHVATLVDNEIKNIPPDNRRSGQPLKMIRQRIKSKEGRIRSNIMGKRVDFSGRTVVGVDPNISIDQYGVPEKIAMNLTFPETVTKYNMTKLYKLVRNGPSIHPGARQITKMNYDENGIPHPEHIYLKYIDRQSVILEEGDVVERHLMDGDWGQFNRQPSLHRMSMMAHKVKVMPGKTFRLNVYVTGPYNADFDGDEMNTHIPQSVETSYELAELTAVPTQIISPAKSAPIIQVNNDTLIGAYLITQPHVKISKKGAMNLLMSNHKFNGILPNTKDGFYTGQDMFSTILPDISFKKGNKSYDNDPSDKNMVIIENGHFKQGILDKTIIGATLIHMIYDAFGSNAVKDFLNNNQRMLNRWLAGYSFTVGLGDCIPTKEDNEKISEFVLTKIKDVNTLIKEANMGIYKQNLDNKYIKISLENDIIDNLKNAKFAFEKYIGKNINKDNSIYILINSGAKGLNDDLSAIRGFIGQQSIMGKRVQDGYTRRTLSHFSKDDYGARSRGFVVNSFFNGMDPIELFFHLMDGRTGLIDTAIKSVSGDTSIIILENGMTKYVRIGEWIDSQLNENTNDIERLPEKDQELLRTKIKTFIPTTDDEGNVSWGEITAITRHDPGEGMYKIRTAGGREVKVVESKSLIVWNESAQKFKEVHTPDVKEGDYLPVTLELSEPPIVNDNDLLTSSKDKLNTYINNLVKERVNFEGKVLIENIKEDEINRISFICSRLGIFTELNDTSILIYWDNKSYKKINNVVLDPIVLIEKLSVNDFPKVYDVTVPSTLNFGLANGLQVRDTAESGYMQRRLIKALEDLSVKYGGTVRNGNNNIVQFVYGDDGIDPCKLNKQEFKLIEYNDQDMEKKFLITSEDVNLLKTLMVPDAFKEMTSDKNYLDKLKEDFDRLLELRKYSRRYYFKNMNVMNSTVFSPINFFRTIMNARDMFKIQLNKKTDLTPDYIRKCFKEIEDEVVKYLPKFSLNIFLGLLHSNLSAKVSIIELKFNKTVFKFIIDTIREKFLSSLVQPGEMVGMVGAQSMGEVLTQMSVPYDTKIMIQTNGKFLKTTIGDYIDETIRSKKGKINVDETGRHTIMEIDSNTLILSVTKDEKMGWRKISKVSRHPVNGQLMKVETRSGRITNATLSHSFLKRTENGIEPIEGKDLKIGDRIPVMNVFPEMDIKKYNINIGEKKVDLDENLGYLCGYYYTNGITSKYGVKLDRKKSNESADSVFERLSIKNSWGIEYRESSIYIKNSLLMEFLNYHFGKDKNEISEFVFQTNLDFIRGFLTAITDNDSSIDEKRMYIRFTNMSRAKVVDLSMLFNYFGIFGYLSSENKKNQLVSVLNISRKYIPDVVRELKIKNLNKMISLQNIINYINREDVHDVSDYVDKIPEVGNLIADVGRLLKLKNNARIYGRWRSKESIGRRTLQKYIETFKVEQTNDPIVLHKIKLLEQAVNSNVIWDEIISIDYSNGADDEYVYDFTVPGSESFMVDDGIMVHNTLNSVEWNTEILIKENGELVRTKIGDWIDTRIENALPENIENHPNETILEYIKDKQIFVPACTENGNIIWDEVEAVTRHPVINKDGSNTLLKITTADGREVIATKAKSFLKRVDNKIIGVDGDEIKVGDYLPAHQNEHYLTERKQDDIIPNVNTKKWGIITISREKIQDYLSSDLNQDDKKVFENILKEDIIYDRVIKIEEIISEHKFVYDLTVKETRNFNIYNGLCMRDTFHSAGTGARSVITTKGVPRVREIINVAKTISSPSMDIYLKPEFTTDVNKAKMIGNQIEFTKLQDIIDKTMIIYENAEHDTMENEDLEFIQTYQEFAELIGVSQCPDDDLSKWVLRVIFNKEKMMSKNIYLADIQDVIQRNGNEDDIQCTFSDDNAKELMMRIRVREDSQDGDYLEFLQELEKILMSITIRGIPNVEKVEPEMMKKVKYNEDGSYTQDSEWYLATIGVNLLDVLMNENVDSNRTLSNDIHEINEIFGIEATRNLIIRELMKLPDYEGYYRHISLLGDIMTHRGVIMPIERHGINRSAERGPIAKATFEESTDILVKASTFAEKDKMGGVSANIMFGQLPKVGTNSFDLLFDESKFIMEIKAMKDKLKYEPKEQVSADKIEDKIMSEYEENLGENIDAQFDFTFDATKSSEKQLVPHIFPETGLETKSVKKRVTIKKK